MLLLLNIPQRIKLNSKQNVSAIKLRIIDCSNRWSQHHGQITEWPIHNFLRPPMKGKYQ
jgi:hypothetical protein